MPPNPVRTAAQKRDEGIARQLAEIADADRARRKAIQQANDHFADLLLQAQELKLASLEDCRRQTDNGRGEPLSRSTVNRFITAAKERRAAKDGG